MIMSKETKPLKSVVFKESPRHPALVRRDALYASTPRHPRLTERGTLKVDPTPFAVDLIGLRPLSLQERVERFGGHGMVDWNLVPDEQFLSEDDWEDHLDDLPEEGFSPYELAGFRNQNFVERLFRGPTRKRKDPSATPLPEGEPDGPHEAKGGSPDPAGTAG